MFDTSNATVQASPTNPPSSAAFWRFWRFCPLDDGFADSTSELAFPRFGRGLVVPPDCFCVFASMLQNRVALSLTTPVHDSGIVSHLPHGFAREHDTWRARRCRMMWLRKSVEQVEQYAGPLYPNLRVARVRFQEVFTRT